MDKEFLEKQKEKLLIKKTHIENQLKKMTHKTNSGYDIDFPQYGESEEAQGLEVEDYEERTGLVGELREEIIKVKKALKKIEKGKYGISEKTGKSITRERLKAYPEAENEI